MDGRNPAAAYHTEWSVIRPADESAVRPRRTLGMNNASYVQAKDIVLAGLLILICSALASAVEYFVDPLAGNDANSGRSASVPFKTIARAMQVVRPTTMDTVNLAAGRYTREVVSITTANVTLKGPGSPELVVIDGIDDNNNWLPKASDSTDKIYDVIVKDVGGTGYPYHFPVGTELRFNYAAMIEVSASGVLIANLTVRNSYGRGIKVSGKGTTRLANVTVDNCIVENCNSGAITMQGVDGSTVSGCTVGNNGIYAPFPRDEKWAGCFQERGVASDPSNWRRNMPVWPSAVNFPECTRVICKGNRVYNNWGEGIGCYLRCRDLQFHDNVIYDNYALQLYINNAVDVAVYRNLIYNTGDSRYFRDGERSGGIAINDENRDHTPGLSDGIGRHRRIFNNVLVGNKYGIGTMFNENDGSTLDNDLIAFNTILWSSRSGISIPRLLAPSVNSRICSNVVVHPGASSNAKLLDLMDQKDLDIVNKDRQSKGLSPYQLKELTGGMTFANNGWSKPVESGGEGIGDQTGDFGIGTFSVEAGKLTANMVQFPAGSIIRQAANPVSTLEQWFWVYNLDGTPRMENGVHVADSAYAELKWDYFLLSRNEVQPDLGAIEFGSGVNHTPVAVSRSYECVEGGSVNIRLVASDADGDALTFEVVDQAVGFSGSGDTWTYQDGGSAVGTAAVLRFRANDGTAVSAEATITVTIVPRGKVWYVAPYGNNANSGLTPDQPFATIAKAIASLANPGDGIVLRGGSYELTAPIILSKDGVLGRPYSFSAYPGERPLLYGASGVPATALLHPLFKGDPITFNGTTYAQDTVFTYATNALLQITGDYNMVEGISIERPGDLAQPGVSSNGVGISVKACTGTVVRNCTVTSPAWHGVQLADVTETLVEGVTVTAAGSYAPFPRTSGVLITGTGIVISNGKQVDVESCKVLRGWGDATVMNQTAADGTDGITVQLCTFGDNVGNGVFINGATNVDVSRNLIFSSGNQSYMRNGIPGNGITINNTGSARRLTNNLLLGNGNAIATAFAAGSAFGLKDDIIGYNTILDPVVWGIRFPLSAGGVSNVSIRGNLVDGAASKLVSIAPGPTMAHNGWSSAVPIEAQGTGDQIGDLFVARQGAVGPDGVDIGFFRFARGSNALDAGVADEVDVDYLGAPRDATPDLGALEGASADGNNAPVGIPMNVLVVMNQSLPIELQGSDQDGDTLSFLVSSADLSAKGVLVGSGSRWVYTPNPGFLGPDRFSFVVSDGAAKSGKTEVTIKVVSRLPGPVGAGADPEAGYSRCGHGTSIAFILFTLAALFHVRNRRHDARD